MDNYYEILGVSKTASKEDIKKAYRKLAHQHHPDKGGDEKKFKKISEAYAVLSNEEKRKQYDMFGKSGPTASGGYSGGFDGFQGADFDFDIGDIFGDIFGFKSNRSGSTRNGEDVVIRISAPLEDLFTDQKKRIKISRLTSCKECSGSGSEKGSKKKKCPDCNGQGRVRAQIGPFAQLRTCQNCSGEGEVIEKKCKKCSGDGRLKETKEITINIPAGIDSGQAFRVAGEGNAGKNGAPAGDLIVEVTVNNNTDFKRDGSNLSKKIKISYSQATLGDKVDIKLLTGKTIALKIPAGTSSGKIFRISDKGLPRVGGYGQGDLYIITEVDIPKKLTRSQKKVVEDLKKEGL